MDGMMQMGLPVLGIVAAAAVTFYAVSFAELREVTIFYLFIYFTLIICFINLLWTIILSWVCVCRNLLEI